MRCEKCGLDRESGSYYTFRYGTSSSTPVDLRPGSEKYRVTTRIAGEKTSWICRKCVLKGIALNFYLGIGFAVVLPVVILLIGAAARSLNGRLLDLIASAGACVMVISFGVGITGIVSGIGEIAVSGENRAIEANRSELNQAGYSVLLNHREYRKMGGR